MAAPATMRGEEEGEQSNFMEWVEKAAAQRDHDDWTRVLQESVDVVGTDFFLEQKLGLADWQPCKLTAMGKEVGFLVTDFDGKPVGQHDSNLGECRRMRR